MLTAKNVSLFLMVPHDTENKVPLFCNIQVSKHDWGIERGKRKPFLIGLVPCSFR